MKNIEITVRIEVRRLEPYPGEVLTRQERVDCGSYDEGAILDRMTSHSGFVRNAAISELEKWFAEHGEEGKEAEASGAGRG